MSRAKTEKRKKKKAVPIYNLGMGWGVAKKKKKVIPINFGMTFMFGLAAVGLGALKNPPMDRSSLKKILGLVTKNPPEDRRVCERRALDTRVVFVEAYLIRIFANVKVFFQYIFIN